MVQMPLVLAFSVTCAPSVALVAPPVGEDAQADWPLQETQPAAVTSRAIAIAPASFLPERAVSSCLNCLADVDPANDHVIAPPDSIDECQARLKRAGVNFRPAILPLTRGKGARHACGARQAVVYRGGPEQITYNIAPVLSCGMALALARLEALVNEEALRRLGEKVTQIEQVGTYNCRLTSHQLGVSEHSYANAIDVRSFTLSSGRRLRVSEVFRQIDERDTRPEGPFLRQIARRSFDEGVFSNVYTPFYDEQHRDHLHFDLARYRIDGSRP